MQSMKGATALLGSMNRQMNLPALQRIAMEFEKENDIMEQRQEIMDDAIDEATGVDDEIESEDVINQVLDEIGVDIGQSVSICVWLISHLLIHTARERAFWHSEDGSARGTSSRGYRRRDSQ